MARDRMVAAVLLAWTLPAGALVHGQTWRGNSITEYRLANGFRARCPLTPWR